MNTASRWLGLAGISALFLGGASEALGVGVDHGFTGGDRVLYDHLNPTRINLSAGSGSIDGQAFSNSATVSIVPVVNGSPSAAFYCYVQNVWPHAGNAGISPGGMVFYCTTVVPPTPDGHPSVAISAGAGFPTNKNALFVGSFLTGPAVGGVVHIIPFYRNGEQVILTPTNSDNAARNGSDIDPGMNDQAGFFAPAASWQWQSFTPSLLPATASAVILDIFVSSFSGHAHNLCVLDPNQIPISPNPVRTCQGQAMLSASASSVGGDTAAIDYRLEANADSQHKVWLGTDASLLPVGDDLYYTAVYRGYVEPVNHLLPR